MIRVPEFRSTWWANKASKGSGNGGYPYGRNVQYCNHLNCFNHQLSHIPWSTAQYARPISVVNNDEIRGGDRYLVYEKPDHVLHHKAYSSAENHSVLQARTTSESYLVLLAQSEKFKKQMLVKSLFFQRRKGTEWRGVGFFRAYTHLSR